MTHMAPSKQGGEVLLMTRRVRVIALDGTVTQARALLNSMASTLLISRQLTKKIATTVADVQKLSQIPPYTVTHGG